MMVLSQAVVKQNWLQPASEMPVIVLTFQTSCFETSHEQKHSTRYPVAQLRQRMLLLHVTLIEWLDVIQ